MIYCELQLADTHLCKLLHAWAASKPKRGIRTSKKKCPSGTLCAPVRHSVSGFSPCPKFQIVWKVAARSKTPTYSHSWLVVVILKVLSLVISQFGTGTRKKTSGNPHLSATVLLFYNILVYFYKCDSAVAGLCKNLRSRYCSHGSFVLQQLIYDAIASYWSTASRMPPIQCISLTGVAGIPALQHAGRLVLPLSRHPGDSRRSRSLHTRWSVYTVKCTSMDYTYGGVSHTEEACTWRNKHTEETYTRYIREGIICTKEHAHGGDVHTEETYTQWTVQMVECKHGHSRILHCVYVSPHICSSMYMSPPCVHPTVCTLHCVYTSLCVHSTVCTLHCCTLHRVLIYSIVYTIHCVHSNVCMPFPCLYSNGSTFQRIYMSHLCLCSPVCKFAHVLLNCN